MAAKHCDSSVWGKEAVFFKKGSVKEEEDDKEAGTASIIHLDSLSETLVEDAYLQGLWS